MEMIIGLGIRRILKNISIDKLIDLIAEKTIEGIIDWIVQHVAEYLPGFVKAKLTKPIGEYVEDFFACKEVKIFLESIQMLINKKTDDLCEKDIKEFECKKKEAFEAVKEESLKFKIPKYMDCVVFTCKEGMALSEDDKELLEAVILQEHKSIDIASLEIIERFLEVYIGEEVVKGNDDIYVITDSSMGFNLSDPYGLIERPYNRNDMNLLMKTLNTLLGIEVFDDYIVGGHDNPNWGE